MTYEGPWYLPNMSGPRHRARGVNFNVIHMPYGQIGSDETVAEITGYALNSASKLHDAGWEWIKFNTTNAAQTHVAKVDVCCRKHQQRWVPLARTVSPDGTCRMP
jgi:maltose-binding protein MalE